MKPVLPTISTRYRIDHEIGRGGMGAVYRGMDTLLNREIAIKLLRGEGLLAPSSVARFVQEGRVCAQLRSDNCVEIFDLGVTEQGQPYLVMELLKGNDFAEELKRGRLPYHRAAALVAQACNAIAEAHELGIVHRDLKPHNLFLCVGAKGTETVKVLDFGISRLPRSGQGAALTVQGELLGTPAYMSPEQVSGRGEVDGRSDIWALGVILYELVSGLVPFAGDTMAQQVYRILHDAPRPLREVAPGTPPSFEAVVHRCLHKDANARYASVSELMRDLAQVVQSERGGRSDDGFALRPTDLAHPAVYGHPSSVPSSLGSSPAVSVYDARNGASLGSFSHTPPLGSMRGTSASGPLVVAGVLGLGVVLLLGLGAGGLVLYRQNAAERPSGALAPNPSAGAVATNATRAPSGPVVWTTEVRNPGGFSASYLKANTDASILVCVRNNEAGLKDAYSPNDLKQGFGVTITHDAAGTVTAVVADALPNIAMWMQACLTGSLVGKKLGPPPSAVKQRDIHIFVTANEKL